MAFDCDTAAWPTCDSQIWLTNDSAAIPFTLANRDYRRLEGMEDNKRVVRRFVEELWNERELNWPTLFLMTTARRTNFDQGRQPCQCLAALRQSEPTSPIGYRASRTFGSQSSKCLQRAIWCSASCPWMEPKPAHGLGFHRPKKE